MRENRIRTMWAAGKAVVNGWLAIPNVFSAETMAHAGWDALTIDMQHGVVDYDAALSMLTAISTTSVAPVVRIPWLDPGVIMKMVETGFRFVTIASDTRLMAAGAQQVVARMREGAVPQPSAAPPSY
jgi:2-keto-3-deoxy-L-rhamnonate aldolase RhmA